MTTIRTRITMLALALAAAVASPAHAAGYKVGQTVPDAALTDASGQSHKLSDFKGHPVVLEWTNYGCPFTQKHYNSGNMQKLQSTYTGKGVIWLSVVSSAEGKQGYLPPEGASTAVARMGFKGTHVILDPKGTLGRAFGAETTPDMFILDKNGKLVYQGAIDSIPSFDQADIAGATNYVVKALDELLAGQPISTPQTRPYGCSIKY